MNKKTILLPEILDASAAENLFQQVQLLIQESVSLSVEASAVSRISTPCLQILAAVEKHCAASQIAFHITSPSSCFSAAAEDLGLTFTS